MMREFMLEVCTDSVESAAAAVRGGARRLEVCANLVIGGTTPGVSQFKQMRKACDIPLNVLLRPRYGDFLYTEAEFTMLLEDTAMFRLSECGWHTGSGTDKKAEGGGRRHAHDASPRI